MKKLLILLLFISPFFTAYSFQFRIGEQITFKINVFGIHVGYQIMTFKGYRSINGKKYLYAIADTRSLPYIERIYKYKLRDIIEVWMEPDTLLPVLIKKDIHEGNWKNRIRIVMDQKNRTAVYYDKRNTKGKRYKLKGPTLDLLSMIYYVRAQKPGNRTIKIDYFDEKKGVIGTAIRIRKYKPLQTRVGMKPTYLYSQIRGHKIKVQVIGDKFRFPIRITVATFQVHDHSINIVGTLDRIR